MQQKKFKESKTKDWQHYDDMVDAIKNNDKDVNVSTLPYLFRKICADLSLSRHRMYGEDLNKELNNRVTDGFRLINREKQSLIIVFIKFFVWKFPETVRREWKLHLLTWLFFLLPALLIFLSAKISGDMEWANSLLDEQQKTQLDMSYGKKAGAINEARGSGGDVMMFGHYIWNNISIDFQIFAGGVLGGVGSLYILFFNAIYFGAVFAYIDAYGDPMSLYGFVSSHAPYELWAMLISAIAGLKVGFSLLMPGRRTRIAALKHAGESAMTLIIGAAVMTFIAAIIEGFWSANTFEALGGSYFKIAVGGVGWLALLLYFLFCGKGQRGEA